MDALFFVLNFYKKHFKTVFSIKSNISLQKSFGALAKQGNNVQLLFLLKLKS